MGFKKAETSKMKEEIEGQETLLEEWKRLFEEECEKFTKYLENEQTKT